MPASAQFAIGIRFGSPFSTSTFNNQYGGIVGENPVAVTQQSNPPLQSGTYYIAILIVTSPAGTGTVTATITAAAPSIAVDSTLNFGGVTTGQGREMSLGLRNRGTAALTVTSVTSSSAQFLVQSPATPFNIAAAAQRDVVIRFQPSAAGPQSATLSIRSDDPERATVTVALSGQGVAPAPTPAISAANGVVNGASFLPGLAAGSWVTIRGSNLSTTSRLWRDSDFQGGRLPTSLDGVSVRINGRDALIYYVSPTQLNVLAPSDPALGTVSITVTNTLGTSAPAAAVYQRYAPELFPFEPQSRRYVAAVHPDGSFAGPDGLFGSAVGTAPVRQGGRVLLYGTGCGPTNPAVDPAVLFSGAAPLASLGDLRILVGNLPATVEFAGLVGNGLCQFNIVVPPVPDGDQTVTIEIAGQRSQAAVRLAVLGNPPPPPAPQITSLSPSSGLPGQTISAFTIAGQDLAEVTAIEFSPGEGITVSNIRATATSVTAQVALSSNVGLGSRSVTAVSPGGRSNALAFSVQTAPPPPSGLEYVPVAQGMVWEYRVDVPAAAALPYLPIVEVPDGLICSNIFCGTLNWAAGQYTFRITAGAGSGTTDAGDTWPLTVTDPAGRFYFGQNSWPVQFRVGVRNGLPQLDALTTPTGTSWRLARLLARLSAADLAARQDLTVGGRQYTDVIRTTVTLRRDGMYLGQDYTEEVFLAPGVGIIRAVMRDASGRTLFTQELTQFTAPPGP
jgi:uncharacterized protein (TIGR03437 family)